MTGQNRHNWPDFFYKETFFEVLSKGVARRLGSPYQLKRCFTFLGLILAEICLKCTILVTNF